MSCWVCGGVKSVTWREVSCRRTPAHLVRCSVSRWSRNETRFSSVGPLLLAPPRVDPCRNPGRPVALGPWGFCREPTNLALRQRAKDAGAPLAPNLAGATLLWAGCAADPMKLLWRARDDDCAQGFRHFRLQVARAESLPSLDGTKHVGSRSKQRAGGCRVDVRAKTRPDHASPKPIARPGKVHNRCAWWDLLNSLSRLVVETGDTPSTVEKQANPHQHSSSLAHLHRDLFSVPPAHRRHPLRGHAMPRQSHAMQRR